MQGVQARERQLLRLQPRLLLHALLQQAQARAGGAAAGVRADPAGLQGQVQRREEVPGVPPPRDQRGDPEEVQRAQGQEGRLQRRPGHAEGQDRAEAGVPERGLHQREHQRAAGRAVRAQPAR